MKKILFLTPFVPSNRAGGENFTRLLLEKLSKLYKIDLVYFAYKGDPLYEIPNANVRVVDVVENSIWVKLKHLALHPLTHPIFTVRFSWTLLRKIKKLLSETHYDFLYLDHSQMFLYGKFFPTMPKILMSHDVMAQRFSRSGNWISKKMVLHGEGTLMNLPNSSLFTFSEKDCNLIKEIYGVKSQMTSFFLDETTKNAIPQEIEKRLVFFGKWNRADNFDGLEWFFDKVYDKINSDFQIVIIGKWLPEDFERKIAKYSNVHYLGFVDNPYMIIANSWATLSPLFSGAGVKVKVVESLACGTPVIGNEISFEGISSDFDFFMLRAESAIDFASLINNLNISLPDRQKFKILFAEKYNKQSILSYLEGC